LTFASCVQATGQLRLSGAIPSQKGYLYKTGSNQKGGKLPIYPSKRGDIISP